MRVTIELPLPFQSVAGVLAAFLMLPINSVAAQSQLLGGR